MGDRSSWWVPSVACLREWVRCSFFELEVELDVARDLPAGSLRERGRKWVHRASPIGRGRYTRVLLRARAVDGPDPYYAFPDRELAAFFGSSAPARPPTR